MIYITIKYFLQAIAAIIICAGSCNAQSITTCGAEAKIHTNGYIADAEEGNSKSLEEQNKSIALGFYEDVVNAHNVEAIHLYASDKYLEHQYDTHFDSDLKGVKKAFKAYFTAFPDMHIKVNFIMVEGDLVTTQITTSGTNTGPIYGHKPTNKKIVINGVDIVRIKNGKVEEHWGYAEEGKLLTQLGLIRPLIKEGMKAQRDAKRRKAHKTFQEANAK